MLKAFNAFQITCLFAAAPFGVGWLFNSDFPWSNAAAWASLIAYAVFFGFMVTFVFSAIERD